MKRIGIICFICVLLLQHYHISAGELNLGCKSGVLIDAKTGRILYEKNCNEKRAMASTTKIMTCIVALENGQSEDVVRVSENASGMPRVRMNVKKGEQYYLKDLLYALMLESYNDVAVAIAEHIGGSTNGFAKMMNDKAKELGLHHSHFVTPNGLDADKHYSTALDMARLGAYAIKNKKFLKIINTKQHHLKEISKKKNIVVHNRDSYLERDNDAIGIKTGFTNKAGYCFVGAIKNKNRTYISCVLASGWPPRKNQKYIDTKILMDYGRKYFFTDCYKIKRTFSIKIDNGNLNRIYANVFGRGKVLKKESEKYRYETKFSYRLPIRKGQAIGYTKIYIDDFFLGRYNIKATVDVPVYDYKYCINKVGNRILLSE